MAKVNAHSDQVLNMLKGTSPTAPTAAYLWLATAASDVRDPSTYTEAAYSGYARVALNQGTDFTGPAAHTTGRKLTWPASGNKDFPAVPAGGVTIVAHGIANHASTALSSTAVRCVDSVYSKAYAQNDVPRLAQNAMTTSEQ